MSQGRYHWSNCAPSAKFFVVSAGAGVPLIGLVLHPSMFMLWTALTGVVVLGIIQVVMRLSIPSFFRTINIWLTGRLKTTDALFKDPAS